MVNIHLRRCTGCTSRKPSSGEVISGNNRARQTPHLLSCSDLRRAQNAGPTESEPLRTTRVTEPERLRPGRCRQPRDGLRWFPAEQPRAWAVWARRLHAPLEGAGPVWLRHCEHMPVLFVCSVSPSPQCDWTSEPKNVSTTAHFVSGQKSDTEETSKQKKLNPRERPWKWQVQ